MMTGLYATTLKTERNRGIPTDTQLRRARRNALQRFILPRVYA